MQAGRVPGQCDVLVAWPAEHVLVFRPALWKRIKAKFGYDLPQRRRTVWSRTLWLGKDNEKAANSAANPYKHQRGGTRVFPRPQSLSFPSSLARNFALTKASPLWWSGMPNSAQAMLSSAGRNTGMCSAGNRTRMSDLPGTLPSCI